MPRSQTIKAGSDVGANTAHVSSALATLSGLRDRAALLDAACAAAGELLALDSVAVVRRTAAGIVCDGRWSRHGARPNRVGEARTAAALDLAEEHGGHVCQRTFGRLELVVIPFADHQGTTHVIAATARPLRRLSATDVAVAEALAAHTAACLEMVAAVTAAREFVMLERAMTPATTTRGDRALEQMQLVQSLAGAITGTHSVHEVGQIVVSRLRSLIEYHSCRFYVVSPDGAQLMPVAHLGISEVYTGDGSDDLTCDVGEGITGRAFVDGFPLRIDDVDLVEHAIDIAGTPPIKESMLLAPMACDQHQVGVIVLSKEGVAQFDDDDLRLLEVVAAQAAVACENVRLYTEQREAAEVSEALLELGAALALQTSVDGIGTMLATAIERLVECAGISVWRRVDDHLVPAAAVGYMPAEQRSLMATRLPANAAPMGPALDSRRMTTLGIEEAPELSAALSAGRDGTTFAVVAVGERAANRGAVVVQRGPRKGRLSRRDEQILLGVADQALLAITNRALYEEIESSFLATAEALGNALDAKDRYTNDHAQALVGLCAEVAGRLGVSGHELRDIRFAAALHDIGKIGIPAEILNKPGPLTEAEFEVMKRHPQLGAQILEPVAALAGAAALVVSCHEHWDGSGYPLALAGDQIPLGARVILACDAFDAMTSDRVYRKAISQGDAFAELRRCAGGHFDPDVVEALLATLRTDVEPAA
jgi:HD-GYP domain-containing protein (c-di-GMP phosphodiesterase class II)/putative methionine-R-sulfoxide reductase with GAF domain